VPTRELAIQVGRNLREYGKYLDLVSTTVYGGVPIEPQEMMLRHGVDVLVATPGRLKDHIWRGNIDFRHTEYLVLDEADRMLDMGFIKDVREIVELIPKERQSMLFSATLDREIQRLCKDILKNPLRIEIAPPSATLDEVDQFVVATNRGRKRSTLESLMRRGTMTRTIVFARTKAGVSKLARELRDGGHKASAIHSDRTQGERVRALEGFREGRVHVLVATDIAARGLDIDDVSHVINFDLPHTASDYVHRIGRTARAGRKGQAISLVTPEDARGLEAIERLISRKLRPMNLDGIPVEIETVPQMAVVSGGGRSDGPRRGRRRAGGGRGPYRETVGSGAPAATAERPAASGVSMESAAGSRPQGRRADRGRRRRPDRRGPESSTAPDRRGRESAASGGRGRGSMPQARPRVTQGGDRPARREAQRPPGLVQSVFGLLKNGLFSGRK
jgi:ATP-dependent RNA helicase RhlE